MQIPMRVPARSRARQPASGLVTAAAPAVVGTAWLGIAGVAAWLVFATPLLSRLLDLGASGPAAPVMGAAALAVALTAPAAFAVVGIARPDARDVAAHARDGLLKRNFCVHAPDHTSQGRVLRNL